MTDDLKRMACNAFALSGLTLEAEVSEAHPDGACTHEHMPCSSCGQLAPIAIKYGGPMADCRRCYFGWGVYHDPVQCWRRSSFFDGQPGAEALVAVRVLELTPLLMAARAVLGDIVDTI